MEDLGRFHLSIVQGGEWPPTTQSGQHSQPWSVGGGGGAIANFGGHKGTGLALMVELLCAALAGGAVLGKDVKKTAKNWGHHVIAIDPESQTQKTDAAG